jgi:hypothetical protein
MVMTLLSLGGHRSSAWGGREAVILWDVNTHQQLLTLAGAGSLLTARWSSDGDVILAGTSN